MKGRVIARFVVSKLGKAIKELDKKHLTYRINDLPDGRYEIEVLG